MAQRGYGEPTGGEWGSDDDRDEYRDRERGWRGGYGRMGRDEDRGFFERAGEEVRSWFGGRDEDERRREGDFGRSDFDTGDSRSSGRDLERGGTRYSGGISDRDRERSFGRIGRSGTGYSERSRGLGPPRGGFRESRFRPGGQRGFQSEYGSREDEGGFGFEDYGRSLGGFGNQRFGRPEDQLYRSWRDRQMSELDRDYDDYCREREQQFDQDFGEWRKNRQQSRPQSGFGEKGELQLEPGMETGTTEAAPDSGAAEGEQTGKGRRSRG